MPATLATVTRAFRFTALLAVVEAILHETEVKLIHDDVAQSMAATATVGVRSVGANCRPLRVAVDPPEKAALPTPTEMELTTGALQQKHTMRYSL